MSAETKPLIPCVCCHQILEAKYQPSVTPTRPGYWLITCLNESCVLQGFTLADLNYPPDNLESYCQSGRERLAKIGAAQ